MSDDYYLACRPCKTFVWIAQDSGGGFTLYSGEPKTMDALKRFLHDHIGHDLVFDESQLLEYAGVIAVNNGKYVHNVETINGFDEALNNDPPPFDRLHSYS